MTFTFLPSGEVIWVSTFFKESLLNPWTCDKKPAIVDVDAYIPMDGATPFRGSGSGVRVHRIGLYRISGTRAEIN